MSDTKKIEATKKVIESATKLPFTKVNREAFLIKELKPYCSEEDLKSAIKYNPAYAGVDIDTIDEIAKGVIRFETNKVSATSLALGLPSSLASIPLTASADLTQYFSNIIIVLQKLAYLYGFEDLNLDENELPDETLNKLVVFIGAMFGVQGAHKGIQILSERAAVQISKKLAAKALTNTFYYPIVKQIAKLLGVQMTKQIFAKTVSKAVPVIGGGISGGLTYATFKPCALRLKSHLRSLPLCDPNNYEHDEND